VVKQGDGWLRDRWEAKLVAHLLATAALWVRIQTFKMGEISKEMAKNKQRKTLTFL
jgi:hypothetical protein